jgi:carotene biosynthesis associated membrane protein
VSVRTYDWQARGGRRSPGGLLVALPWVLTVATVLAQVTYPLVEGDARTRLTQVTVVLFFLASASHAAVWRGRAWAAAYVVLAVGVGLAVEAIGVGSGFPFGTYDYTGTLGREVLGVPFVIPLAWAMMAYPALIAARRLCTGTFTTVLVGAVALASWDVFLDPQMVGEGHWSFTYPDPSPPLVGDIPWTNFAGWFLVAIVLMAVLDRLPRRSAPDAAPAVLYLWTYVSSIIANLFFWDRPEVALAGGLVMGVVALPYAWRLWVDRP